MEEISPLDRLLREIRWAEAQRYAAEEELNRTPGWRFRERARRRAHLEYRLASKKLAVAVAAEIAGATAPSDPVERGHQS